MTAIALALGASLAWGLGDFLGGLKSRTLHVLTVLAISQAAGFVAVLAWLAVSGDAFPGGAATAWAVAAGVGGCVGLGALYRGMAVGAMGIVAPVSRRVGRDPVHGRCRVGRASRRATGGRDPAGAGGRRARLPRAGGARAAAVPRASGSRSSRRSASGSTSSSSTARREESVPWAVATARGISSLLAVVAAIVVGASLRPGLIHMPVLVAVGLCDVGANVLFGLASTRGLLSVVAVLASLYPIVTVGLAALLLHERIAPAQRVGVAGALAGAALITAG